MISDSLGLPRLTPEKVIFKNTYFAKLRDANTDLSFVQLFIGAANLPFLYSNSVYYEAFEPDLVFVQSGVVDCAPRAFRNIELAILRKIKIKVSKSMLPTLRKYRKIRYTSPILFRKSIQNMQARFGKEKVYWIAIMPASDSWEKIVPGIKTSVEKYNRILAEELGNNLLVRNAETNWLMSDYHHMNELGHREVSVQINKVIQNKKLAIAAK